LHIQFFFIIIIIVVVFNIMVTTSMTLVSFSLNLIKSNNHNKMKHMAEKLVNFLAIKISALIRLVTIINKTIALRRLWI
jgi:hypothetical protein